MKHREFTDLVTDALASPTFDAFTTCLRKAGYNLQIRGHNPALVAPGGNRHHWFYRVNMNRAFWIAYSSWPEEFEYWLRSTGSQALPRLWQGLFGYSCDSHVRDTMAGFVAQLGALRTGQALCLAARASGATPSNNVLLLFIIACKRDLEEIRKDAESRAATVSKGTATTAIPVMTSVSVKPVIAAAPCPRLPPPPPPPPPPPAPMPPPFPRLLPPPPPPPVPTPPRPQIGVGADAPVFVAALPQQRGQELPAGHLPERLADTVALALTKPLRSCFEGWMLQAGYQVHLRGPCAVLVPLDGGTTVTMESLALSREFWLRAVEWPDGFALSCVDDGPQSLYDLWSGLFGCPPGPDDVDAIRRLLLHLHVPAVAHALYSTATHQPSASAQHRLAYFQAIAVRMVRKLRTNLSANEQRAALMSVPADMRPRYRWTGREIRSRSSGISEILPCVTADSAAPSTAPGAVFDKENATENRTRSATWATTSSGYK